MGQSNTGGARDSSAQVYHLEFLDRHPSTHAEPGPVELSCGCGMGSQLLFVCCKGSYVRCKVDSSSQSYKQVIILLEAEPVRAADALPSLLGWVYTLSWSLSFYPQPLLNWQRGSTVGLTVDFPAINVLGFISYTISCACFLYSPVIREEYAVRHPRSQEPTVRLNDLAFGMHAVVITALTYSQFYPLLWKLEVGPEQRISKAMAALFWGCISAVTCMVVAVGVGNSGAQSAVHGLGWIDVVGQINPGGPTYLTVLDLYFWLCQAGRDLV